MKKKVILFVFMILIGIVAIKVKGYLCEDYTMADHFYTRIPMDEVNRYSWLINNHGEKQFIGREYFLIGYNEQGQSCHITFIANCYKPGTYIELNTNKKIVIDQRIIKESDVPKRALAQIKYYGTK